MSWDFDVAVVGAGAAGLMCAAQAGQGGLRVVLFEHSAKLAEKIRISGGGRCNFTNLHASYQNFVSENPQFCRSALSRYTPQDFLVLLKRYQISWHEKHKGQLFCDDSAEQIIRMLQAECAAGQVLIKASCGVQQVQQIEGGFNLTTAQGEYKVARLVIASGGLSIPKIGATDFAHRLTRQFGLRLVEPRPGLVPLTFAEADWKNFVALAGIAMEVDIAVGEKKQRVSFREDLLFTHRGLSGPAVLQISSFWRAGQALQINLLPELDLAASLIEQKSGNKKQLLTVLGQYLPQRLAEGLLQAYAYDGTQRLADCSDKLLRELGQRVNQWHITPDGTEGYRKAEVTVGGVDTRELSQQSMMVKSVPGLYFIGEAVDVTGWLGGYNFQWAWASAYAAAADLLASEID